MKFLRSGIFLERVAEHVFRSFLLVFCEVAHVCLWYLVKKGFVVERHSAHETLLEGCPHPLQLIQDVIFINVEGFLEE